MTGAAPSPVRGRIADIEVLRAVAIVFVLIEHSLWNLVFDVPWLGWLLVHAPLWCGVDLFFVVSGFVITRGLLPALAGTPHPGAVLRRFWVRRVFRLWPASWCWLALIVAGAAIFREPAFMGPLPLNMRGALAGAFGFADIRFGLHGLGVFYGPSFPFWSLSLEEQFYIVLPLAMLLARRHMAALACLLLLVQLPLAHPRLYFFLRTDGLLWGVLLAASPWLGQAARAASRRLANIPFGAPLVLAASLAAMTQLCPPMEQSGPFWLGGLAAAAAIPVWLASADAGLFRLPRGQSVVLWLGGRSYALYVCHMPVFQCAAALSRQFAPASLLLGDHVEARSVMIGLPLLAAAAEATYRLIETPLRRYGVRMAGPPRYVAVGVNTARPARNEEPSH